MITLQPSRRLIQATNLDFNLLTSIINTIIKHDTHFTLKCVRYKRCYSDILFKTKTIRLSIREQHDIKYYIGTILHEIRHYIQYLKYQDKLTFNYNDYNEYYYSPEERDARKFETIATEVCKIYQSYIKISEKFKKYNLNELKELDYLYKNENDQEIATV